MSHLFTAAMERLSDAAPWLAAAALGIVADRVIAGLVAASMGVTT